MLLSLSELSNWIVKKVMHFDQFSEIHVVNTQNYDLTIE